jgi:hypothetical protein
MTDRKRYKPEETSSTSYALSSTIRVSSGIHAVLSPISDADATGYPRGHPGTETPPKAIVFSCELENSTMMPCYRPWPAASRGHG